jgi:hypothetical protein
MATSGGLAGQGMQHEWGEDKCMYIVDGKSRKKEATRWVYSLKTDPGEMGWGAQVRDHW